MTDLVEENFNRIVENAIANAGETEAAALEGIVVADAAIKGLVTKFAKAKHIEDQAKAESERLRKILNAKFVEAGAAKFTHADGDTLISRSQVTAAEQVDMEMLRKEFPDVYLKVRKPRTKFYRINLGGRLRRR